MLPAPQPMSATPRASPWLRLARWLEAVTLLAGMAWAMLGCSSGTQVGETLGRGLGAWWGGISGDELDVARGQAMGRAVGGWIGSSAGIEADQRMRQTPGQGFTW